MAKVNPWWPKEVAAWTPPEILTVSECADKYRVLGIKSEKRGPWETAHNPVMRVPMNAFGIEGIEEVWLIKPTQSGGTDGLLNMVLYAAIQNPGNMLVVEPNEDLADDISQERIDDMIKYCDKLMEIEDSDKTGKKKKTFSSMTVYFGWAGSAASLASRPLPFVLFDEVDKYPQFSGREASPVKLGKERTNTFRFTRKIVYISTPTTEEGYVTAGEAACDARFRYLITCPHCGHKQEFKLVQAKTGEDHTPLVVEQATWYECEKCQDRIYEDQRMELVRRGDWYEKKSNLKFDDHIAKHRPKSVGFQFSRFYTPWFTFGEILAEFFRSKNSPEQLMNFKNSWLAEPWIERILQKDEAEILSHRCKLPRLIVPDDAMALTLGVDPGQGGWWYAVWAICRNGNKNLVDHGFIKDEAVLRQLMHENVYHTEDGEWAYPIWRGGMDTGGSKYDDADVTMTEAAYAFLRQYGGGKVFGTKGESRKALARLRHTVIDKMPGKNGLPIPGGLMMWLMNADAFKDNFHYYLQLPKGEPGSIYLHADTDELFAAHVLAEEKRRNKKQEWEWVLVKHDNHLFDCSLIALAMADPECWGGVSVLRDPQRYKVHKDDEEHRQREENKRESFVGAKRRGWIRGE